MVNKPYYISHYIDIIVELSITNSLTIIVTKLMNK